MDFRASLAGAEPPAVDRPLRALWWLAKGGFRPGADWEKAHALCQEAEGSPACDRVHALVHWIEGDEGNSAYWYRRAGTPRRGTTPEAEWEAQCADLGGPGA